MKYIIKESRLKKIINEGLIDDIKHFFEIASPEMLEKDIVKKLKDFYEKNLKFDNITDEKDLTTSASTVNNKTIDSLGTVKYIVYNKNVRKTYLFNEKNKTNFYTIIKENCNESDDTFVLQSKLEVGEKYITYFKYDNSGEIVYEKRINLIKKTTNIRELFYKTEKGKIFLNNYNNEKTINFTTNKFKDGTQK